MAGTRLGSGYIELSVKYKGALDQIRTDLTRLESDSKKTTEVIKTHVERSVTELSDGAKAAAAGFQKVTQGYMEDVKKARQAEQEFAAANRAYVNEQKGSSEELAKLTKKRVEAQEQETDSLKRAHAVKRQYFQELEKSENAALGFSGRLLKRFGTDMQSLERAAPGFGARIGSAIAAPIGFAIRGIKSVFTTVMGTLADIASGALRGAMLASGATIAAAFGAALYTGIKRLDTLQEIRLKFKFDGISAAQTELAISDMRELATKLSRPFEELITQAEVFVAAGVQPGSDLNAVMEDAANVAAKTGQSVSSVSDTMLRFMQGHTQEASMALETWQRGGVNVVGGLAARLGVSTSTVYEMLQKGQISWAQVQRELAEQLGGYAEQSGQTIVAKMTVAWGKITDIGEAVLAPFFGSTVNGIQTMIDRLEEFAEFLRENQPAVVRFVGAIIENFIAAGKQVAMFAATALDAIGAVLGAAGTVMDKLPGWMGGDDETAQALFTARDSLKGVAEDIRGTGTAFDNAQIGAAQYFESLASATELLNAFDGASGEALDNGRILVTGTAEQVTAAKENLDKLQIAYQTLEPGKIEVLPETDEAKRLIDGFRVAAGEEPLFLNVTLRYTDPSQLAPDGTIRVPGEASRVGGDRPGSGPTPYGGSMGLKPKPEEKTWQEQLPEMLLGIPGRWIQEAFSNPPIENPDGSFTDQITGETWFNQGGPVSGNKPEPAVPSMPGVKGSPGQGFPISGYFNDPANPDGSLPPLIPVDVDPKPAVETVKVFTDGIKDAEPTPTPMTADLEKAESEYKKFADKVKNEPLEIPLIASMMGGLGGMLGGIAPPGDRSGLKPQSIAALDAIQTRFPDAKLTSGFRAQDPYEWHPNGRGLDLQVGDPFSAEGKARGDQLNAWILANKEMLGVAGTLWQEADHFDHIHVSMKDAASPLLAAGGVMPNSGGPGSPPGGGGSGGIRGVPFPRSFGPAPRGPMLPGIDDQDNPTGPKPVPKDWKPTSIPGSDPNYTKPDADADKEAKGPNYTGDYADTSASYLPDVAGYFDPNMQAVMASPEVTPEEQGRLQNALDKINDYQTKIAIAEQKLEELRATKNVKPSAIMAQEQSIANLKRELDQAKTALTTLQDKVLEPAKGGKGGASGNGFWDQTLGEFVQARMPDVAGIGDIAMGGLRETFMPPGFSDPTGWGLTQAAGGVMGFLSGVSGGLGNPYAAAALSMGGSALGGDGGGIGGSLMSMLPYPFGTLESGSPEDAPVMPGMPGGGEGVHMPAGSVPGQPIAPGPAGGVVNDYSVNVTGDQTAIEANTVSNAVKIQAPEIRAALGRKN